MTNLDEELRKLRHLSTPESLGYHFAHPYRIWYDSGRRLAIRALEKAKAKQDGNSN